jgi:hypothetical protein
VVPVPSQPVVAKEAIGNAALIVPKLPARRKSRRMELNDFTYALSLA